GRSESDFAYTTLFRSKDDHGGRVRRELVAGRPDHLAEFRDDLPVEERQAPQRTLLGPLAALAGLLLGVRSLVFGIRHVDGAHGVRHSSSPDSGSWPCRARSEPHGGALLYVHAHTSWRRSV